MGHVYFKVATSIMLAQNTPTCRAANQATRQDWLSHAVENNDTAAERQTLTAVAGLKRPVTCP